MGYLATSGVSDGSVRSALEAARGLFSDPEAARDRLIAFFRTVPRGDRRELANILISRHRVPRAPVENALERARGSGVTVGLDMKKVAMLAAAVGFAYWVISGKSRRK